MPHAAIMSLEAAGNENKFRRSKEKIFVMERKQREKRKRNREKKKEEERHSCTHEKIKSLCKKEVNSA